MSLDHKFWNFEPECQECGSEFVRTIRWNNGDSVFIDCNQCEYDGRVEVCSLR